MEKIKNFLIKVRNAVWPAYRQKQCSLSELPQTLFGKLALLMLIVVGIVIVGVITALSYSWKYIFSALFIAALVFIYTLTRYYTYTRGVYCLVPCKALRKERRSLIATFTGKSNNYDFVTVELLEDKSQRELEIYRQTLNIGCYYLLYLKPDKDGNPDFKNIIAVEDYMPPSENNEKTDEGERAVIVPLSDYINGNPRNDDE